MAGGARSLPEETHFACAYSAAELRTILCAQVHKMPLSGLDPSMLIGFVARDETRVAGRIGSPAPSSQSRTSRQRGPVRRMTTTWVSRVSRTLRRRRRAAKTAICRACRMRRSLLRGTMYYPASGMTCPPALGMLRCRLGHGASSSVTLSHPQPLKLKLDQQQ
ncbi:hypothetical protein C8R44DRAFT_259969 [Mycena epipterygia]|nr:hypothetical protein C8R44DRAFT_259969 [Mycena epipterygia]